MGLDIVAFLREAANQGVRTPPERGDGSAFPPYEPPTDGGTRMARLNYYREKYSEPPKSRGLE